MLRRTEQEEITPTNAPYVADASTSAILTSEAALTQEQDSELAQLTACIEAGVARNKNRGKIIQRLNFAYSTALILVGLGIFASVMRGIVPSLWISLLIMAVSVAGAPLIVGGLMLWTRRAQRAERTAAKRLAESNDVRTVAALIDAIRWLPDRAALPELWQALGRLLPRMTEDEARELGQERLGLLALWMQIWDLPLGRRQLGWEDNQPLLGTLHVMSLMGQSWFQTWDPPTRKSVYLMAILEKWIAGQGAGKELEVRQAAEACRAAIRQKQAQAKSSKHLLRASAPTPTGPEMLLRPAQGTTHTAPEELLRPDKQE